MYNDKIKVANKIISYDALFEIFSKMQEKLVYYQKIYYNEEIQNRVLSYSYQKWSFKDSGSHLKFDVDFYDDTSITFDNYNNFIGIFNSRLEDIKRIYVRFNLSYTIKDETHNNEWYTQHINMWIQEEKMDIEISLNSSDNKIDDIYELIKNKVLSAPEKYDMVIKKKTAISNIVGLSIGLIPGLIISTLLIFIPNIRHIFAQSYVLYPICVLFLSFIIGGTISSSKLDSLYKNIVPEKKYAGYDSNKGSSIYKDDIDKYVETSEILIGKNSNNLKCRNEIMEYYEKYKKNIPSELAILALLSLIVIFLGNL